jgi:hypothetical protein
MVDGDVLDDAPRSGPDDLAHWSNRTVPPGVATLPPLPTGTHRLYIELADDSGEKSLGIVRIEAISVQPVADLLVVNDTRLELDKFVRDGTHYKGPAPYTTVWPSRTELDTFLFARGGYPWRGTQDPPTGAVSPPGLLAGYSFDTLGTRLGLEEAADGVPLATLLRYRHVLWLVDVKGAAFAYGMDQAYSPVTALRDMSEPGRASALAAYIAAGGQVWLAGGGAVFASLAAFDKPANNPFPAYLFTARDDELGTGRPMYDAAHVRSALVAAKANAQFSRSPAAVGGWSGHGPDGALSAPDYARAPAALAPRDPATDPLPPTRLASQASLYYLQSQSGPVEYVREPNDVVEDFGAPGTPLMQPALDTLYQADAFAAGITNAPAMLYYHGRDNPPFVFTGFDLWSWSRADCQALVDFVLGEIWKLPKSATGARPVSSLGVRSPRPPLAAPSRRADPRPMRP